MRSDQQLTRTFSDSKEWQKKQNANGEESQLRNRMLLPSMDRGKMSFSGKEKNHLFLNRFGKSFEDVSGISGVNSPQDSRSFAVLDFDRDGWQDMAMVSVNAPVVRLYKNQINKTEQIRDESHNFIAVKVVGGNKDPQKSSEFSCRDGYGAKVTVQLADMVLSREFRCGEGLGAQNSDTLMVGIGDVSTVESIEIRWPSGKIQVAKNVAANKLITVFEDESESSDGSGFESVDYLKPNADVRSNEKVASQLDSLANASSEAEIQLLVAFSTTCEACAAKLPALSMLRNQFEDKELSFRGISVDQNDDISMISRFVNKFHPVYTIETNWSRKEQADLKKILNEELGQIIFPAVLIADKSGKILQVSHSVPTVSDIKRTQMELRK